MVEERNNGKNKQPKHANMDNWITLIEDLRGWLVIQDLSRMNIKDI